MAVPAAAQASPQLPAGYQTEVRLDEGNNPFGFHGFVVGLAGTIYAGINDQVVEIDTLGNRTVIHQFTPKPYFYLAFIGRIGNDLYYAEGSTNILWRRDLATGTKTSGSIPSGLFDLTVAPTGELVASAAFFGSDNNLWFVDFVGGQHRVVVALTGPSGPLLFDSVGNLYYGRPDPSYPISPGMAQVLRFGAAAVTAALQGGTALQESQGTALFPGGLDGAFDMAWDDRGRLYISDANYGDILRTLPGTTTLDAVPFVARPTPPATEGVLQLQYVEEGAPTFDAFQPDSGGSMYATFADFGSIAEVHRMRTDRPVVVSSPTATAPPGPISMVMSNLPPNGPVALCISALSPVPERPILSLFGTPVWSGLDLSIAPICLPAIANATGDATLPLTHPGGFGATVYFQALGLDAPNPTLVGTSTIYSLTLLP